MLLPLQYLPSAYRKFANDHNTVNKDLSSFSVPNANFWLWYDCSASLKILSILQPNWLQLFCFIYIQHLQLSYP